VAFSRAIDPRLWLAGLDTPGMVFGFPDEEFRLLSAILVVVVVAGVLIGGLFGDLWGRRRVMLLSLVVSTATGVAAQIVVNTPWLTIMRGVTAATGAMALPLTLAVIRLTFEGRERQVTMFIYTVVCEGALLVALVSLVQVIEGDLLASLLPTALSVIGLYLAWRYVPESRASRQLRRHAATSIAWALTFLPLTLAFVSAQLADRWSNPVTLVAGAIGCLGIVALALAWRGRIWVSATANIRRRRRHLLSVMLLTAAALTLGITGYAVELYRFFSVVQGYGNVVGGLALVPMLAAVLVTAPRAAKLASRLGARRVIAGGLALMGTAMLATALIRPDAGYWLLVLPLGVFGSGYLVAQTAWTIAFMNEMPDAVVGASAAIAQATSSTGAALGGALLGITLHEIGQARLDRRVAELQLSAEQLAAARATLEGLLRGDVALPASDAARQAVFGAYADAYTAGLAVGLVIGGTICLVAAVTAWFGLEPEQLGRASSNGATIGAGLGDLVWARQHAMAVSEGPPLLTDEIAVLEQQVAHPGTEGDRQRDGASVQVSRGRRVAQRRRALVQPAGLPNWPVALRVGDLAALDAGCWRQSSPPSSALPRPPELTQFATRLAAVAQPRARLRVDHQAVVEAPLMVAAWLQWAEEASLAPLLPWKRVVLLELRHRQHRPVNCRHGLAVPALRKNSLGSPQQHQTASPRPGCASAWHGHLTRARHALQGGGPPRLAGHRACDGAAGGPDPRAPGQRPRSTRPTGQPSLACNRPARARRQSGQSAPATTRQSPTRIPPGSCQLFSFRLLPVPAQLQRCRPLVTSRRCRSSTQRMSFPCGHGQQWSTSIRGVLGIGPTSHSHTTLAAVLPSNLG
jgi:hypothetical protein